MIEVKGTRTSGTEAPASQKLALQSTLRESAAPFYFGMFLTGVALYLKSFVPDSSSPPPTEESEEIERKPAQELAAATDDEVDVIPDVPPAAGPEAEPGPARASGGTVVDGRLFAGDIAPSGSGSVVENLAFQPSQGGTASSSPRRSSVSETNADRRAAAPAVSSDDSDPDDDNDKVPIVNRAPRVSGPVYLTDVVGCGALVIALSDLLRNAIDPDGDRLFVNILDISSGSLIRSGDGWVFRSDALGPVTITYEITDGRYTVQQTAHFAVERQPPIVGTAGDDMLIGGACHDDIDAGAGSDRIDGGGGHDLIVAGAGDDYIVAGSGDDTVIGGAGEDVVFGGAGHDRISGGGGNDRLFGEAGHDVMFGGDGDDLLAGGEGDDLLFGDGGEDIVYGDSGRDLLEGGAGADQLFGGAGDDVIDGGDGADLLEGNEGNDVFLSSLGADRARGGDGDDVFVGGADAAPDFFNGEAGYDTLDYSGVSRAMHLDLVSGTSSGADTGNDSFANVERFIGGQDDDHFVVGTASACLEGQDGEDTFEFTIPQGTQDVVLLHEILDFKAGDRVRMSKYDIFEKVVDELEDEFEKIYGDEVDEDDAAIRYRHDDSGEIYRTIIEADFNDDDVYELVIELQGHHALIMVGNV